MRRISVIVPALNEAACIGACLQPLQSLRQQGHEVIVVDGGSEDKTAAIAESFADRVIVCAKSRALQMNQGAHNCSGSILLFLHADTRLPDDVAEILAAVSAKDPVWGRFQVQLSGSARLLRVVEFFMNLRSRLTGIITGDQAMFVSRDLFFAVGGFPEVELMEDIAISTALRKRLWPVCMPQAVITSSRRWEQQGIVRTIVKMWILRLRFFLGANPRRLARDYE